MSDIEHLQGRILAALERASRGADKLAVAKAEVPDLSEELAQERAVNAELSEQVTALKKRLEDETAHLRAELATAQARNNSAAAAQAQTEKLDLEIQRVRRANAQLADACAALRAANAEGVGDADLINASLQAELDALYAARRADVAEADAILSVLTPLVPTAEESA
jgi:chromosome segregation ATPase